jgi:VWFA-related protein
MQRFSAVRFAIFPIILTVFAAASAAQQFGRTMPVVAGARIHAVNHFGKIEVRALEADPTGSKKEGADVLISASGVSSDGDIKITSNPSEIGLTVSPTDKRRIDVTVTVPAWTKVRLETLDGEVRVGGNIADVQISTDTGTIALDIPVDDVRYSMLWTSSRPRYLSDFPLEKVKEKAAGKFQISGTYSEEKARGPSRGVESKAEQSNGLVLKENEVPAADGNRQVRLDLQTARGIILLNVPPSEVTGDLRERPLTNAARSIIRSGDSLLMEAIRRAAPKYYGDYLRTLPPIKQEPAFADRQGRLPGTTGAVRVASARAMGPGNRAVAGLGPEDFEVIESGVTREILSVRPSAAPFNLVLLLDVSGSVESYVDFIRKAARSFVSTVDPRDRVSIIAFNEDVNPLTGFTTDKQKLSESLDSFDAGGATAFYDALGYTLADTLRPLKGERTAIVILSDGDDNRSFLPFESMLAAIQESGALIYPLYVPSGLIAAGDSEPSAPLDPLRTRYMHGEISSKAKAEGKRLAEVSGGVYYQIDRLSEMQAAYADIVSQLRTAYEIEYRSGPGAEPGVGPNLRIRAKRPNVYVHTRSVVAAPGS